MVDAQSGKDRGDERDKRNPYGARWPKVLSGKLMLKAVKLIENACRRGNRRFPGHRWRVAVASAFEETRPEALLDGAEAPKGRRMVKLKLTGRCRQGAMRV